jgi:hypothetical protein
VQSLALHMVVEYWAKNSYMSNKAQSNNSILSLKYTVKHTTKHTYVVNV